MIKRMPLAIALMMMALLPALARADESAGPKPELVPSHFSSQIVLEAVWVIAIFVIMLLILYPTAWKNVLAGLKAREDGIRKDIAEAEAKRIAADKTLREFEARLATADQKSRDMLNQAAIDAEKISTSIRMKAQQDAEEAKEKATREIEAAKQQALNEIYLQTADLATSVAEKIIKRSLNANDQRDLVTQTLEQLKTVNRN